MRSSRDIIIRTQEWGRALKFYGRAMGLRASGRTGTMAGFETGSFRLYVEKGRRHGPVFEFLVADVAEAKARLLAAGCRLIEEDPGQPRCYVRDPFGMTFNIGQARPRAKGGGRKG
jgi:catechol 2,3-dioxygenase-like lactoylglutathione lyase family enzyme